MSLQSFTYNGTIIYQNGVAYIGQNCCCGTPCTDCGTATSLTVAFSFDGPLSSDSAHGTITGVGAGPNYSEYSGRLTSDSDPDASYPFTLSCDSDDGTWSVSCDVGGADIIFTGSAMLGCTGGGPSGTVALTNTGFIPGGTGSTTIPSP